MIVQVNKKVDYSLTDVIPVGSKVHFMYNGVYVGTGPVNAFTTFDNICNVIVKASTDELNKKPVITITKVKPNDFVLRIFND